MLSALRFWCLMTLAAAAGGCLQPPQNPAPAPASAPEPMRRPAPEQGAPRSAAAARLDAARARCPVPMQPDLEQEPEQIAPDERVPDFLLASERCEIFDSRELVGKQPFVVVFFASWCSVCEHKFPLIHRALEEHGDDVKALFVSLDDDEGWADTEQFLARNDMVPTSAVVGRDYMPFSLGYNPFRSVPVVVVVGRSGRVVDVQIGVRDGDEDRLEEALDIAIDELPEATELTSL
ncbi:MAG TPA: redoxin family protein [Polyangiaceae bacterium]|nr:redoxin family protein [Polyangiaceae bacterium]